MIIDPLLEIVSSLATLFSLRKVRNSLFSLASLLKLNAMLTHITFEIVWFRCCLPDMSIHPSQPTPLYCDNKSSIDIAHTDVFHEHTKHIEIDFLFI